METFSYVPEFGANKSKKPDVKVVKFGDGYESRIKSGLQRAPAVWALTFANRELTDGNAIEAFFEARDGSEAFLWTPPDASSPITVVCREWQKQIVKGTYVSIVCQFDEVFEV